ncbi:Os08g0184800, partial [Oryza sativa Japonica Group]
SACLNSCDLHPNVKVDSWFLSLYTSAASASRADPLSAATGGVDPATSSPPAWIPSSLRSPLVRICRPRRWVGRSGDLRRLSTLRSC